MTSSNPTFLTLPPEIRMQIYIHLVTPSTPFPPRHLCPNWSYDPSLAPKPVLEVLLIGTYPKRGLKSPYISHHIKRAQEKEVTRLKKEADWIERGGGAEAEKERFFREEPEGLDPGETPEVLFHSPWALARVCTLVHRETEGLLKILEEDLRDVNFIFHAFTVQDMRDWVEKMGEERLRRLRRWTLEGMGRCRNRRWAYGVFNLNIGEPDPERKSERVYDLKGEGWCTWFEETGYCYRTLAVDLTPSRVSGEYDVPLPIADVDSDSDPNDILFNDNTSPVSDNPPTIDELIYPDEPIIYDLQVCDHDRSDPCIDNCDEPTRSKVNDAWTGWRLPEEERARFFDGEVVVTGVTMVALLQALLGGEVSKDDVEFRE